METPRHDTGLIGEETAVPPCRINLPGRRVDCSKPARRHASGFLQHVVFVDQKIVSRCFRGIINKTN